MNKYKIGINVGSETIECGVVKNGQVEIVNYCESRRSFLIFVYYCPNSPEIVVGDAAKWLYSVYPSQTVYDVMKLIGVRYNDIELQENMKQWKFKVINEGGKPKVEMLHNNRIIHLSGIEILSEILKYIKEQADQSCGNDVNLKTECVISIPSHLTDFQRICIIDACERVNLKVLETASSSICANIGYIHKNNFSKESETNLIFILDYGGLVIDIIKCDNKNKYIELLFSKNDKELRMNKIIDNVCNYYVNKFESEAKKSLNDRRLYKLRRECEESIRLLCAEDCDACYLLMEFLEDEGIDTILSMELFNTLNNDILKRISDYTKTAVEELGLHSSDIDNVILVGYGSRIKRIREMLKETYHSSYIENYYNSEEICVVGATYIANINNFYRIFETVDKEKSERKDYLRNIITSLNGIINDIKSNEFISIIKEVNNYIRSEKSDIRRCDEYLSKIEVYKIYILL